MRSKAREVFHQSGSGATGDHWRLCRQVRAAKRPLTVEEAAWGAAKLVMYCSTTSRKGVSGGKVPEKAYKERKRDR